jgi:putative ABC transport system permease protein
MAYLVTHRTHEIGIRIAIGAQPRRVLSLLMGHGARLAALGVAIGTVAALMLTRLMSSLLFGVAPTDAATFSAAIVFLVVIALLACCIPAWRATRVDPMVALRNE